MLKHWRTALMLGATFVAGAAYAGPPLICHPFDAGTAQLLPWAQGEGWNNPDPDYDVRQLTAQTLRSLTADAPVLARMENLRRATIYAAQDPAIAAQLLSAVLERAARSGAPAAANAPAWFDAGYLLASYEQASWLDGWDLFARFDRAALPELRDLDGFRIVQQAIAVGSLSPEMEFAASLMASDEAVAAIHRSRAAAGAEAGSLLAKNLSH